MNIVKRLAVVILGAILFFSTIGAAWTHVGVTTLGDRDVVKGWLEESNLYDKAVDVVLEGVHSAAEEQKSGEIPLDDPQIKAIASEAFSPDFLKQNIEQVVDGMYAWLDGETASPEFRVDLSAAKQKLAVGISQYAVNRAQALPACTAEQSREVLASGEYDILNATCLPAGVDVNAVAANLQSEIATSRDFLEDTVITPEVVGLDNPAELRKIKSTYEQSKNWPYILGAVALLAAVGIVFLSSSRRAGFLRAGLVFISASLLLYISHHGFKAAAGMLNNEAVKVSGDSVAGAELFRDFIGVTSRDIYGPLLWYAVGTFLIGAVCIGVYVYLSKRTSGDGSNIDSQDSVPLAGVGNTPNEPVHRQSSSDPHDRPKIQ